MKRDTASEWGCHLFRSFFDSGWRTKYEVFKPKTSANRIQTSDNAPAKWHLALNNAKNLQDDVGAANADVDIVAYGPGINMRTLESPTGARIADAMKANAKVLTCENTMHSQQLGKDNMLAGISYVPAGVTGMMKRRDEGWACLRP